MAKIHPIPDISGNPLNVISLEIGTGSGFDGILARDFSCRAQSGF
jgi:hypothetical protein